MGRSSTIGSRCSNDTFRNPSHPNSLFCSPLVCLHSQAGSPQMVAKMAHRTSRLPTCLLAIPAEEEFLSPKSSAKVPGPSLSGTDLSHVPSLNKSLWLRKIEHILLIAEALPTCLAMESESRISPFPKSLWVENGRKGPSKEKIKM